MSARLSHLEAARVAREQRKAFRALVDAGYMPLDHYVELFGAPPSDFPEPAAARHPPLTRTETADYRLPAADPIREGAA